MDITIILNKYKQIPSKLFLPAHINDEGNAIVMSKKVFDINHGCLKNISVPIFVITPKENFSKEYDNVEVIKDVKYLFEKKFNYHILCGGRMGASIVDSIVYHADNVFVLNDKRDAVLDTMLQIYDFDKNNQFELLSKEHYSYAVTKNTYIRH